VLPSWNLKDIGFPHPHDWARLVLKHNFGCSGKKVFVGNAIEKMYRNIEQPQEWIIQQRVELNQMFTRLLYSQAQPLRMDLGVFVHYEYIDGKLVHFKITGMISRGSHNYRVNLNLGGASIPVFVIEN